MSALRELVAEAVKASRGYLRKEAVKDLIQAEIEARVATGEIRNQADLDDFFKTVDMATVALRMIPHAVWSSRTRKSRAV